MMLSLVGEFKKTSKVISAETAMAHMALEAEKFDLQLPNQYDKAVRGFEVMAEAGQRPHQEHKMMTYSA